MPKLKADLLRNYDPREWTLIPLHTWNAVSVNRHGRKQKDGKRPRHRNWTVRNYQSAAVLKTCLDQGWNVGVRLKPTQLVVDVDPRNGGSDGWDDLCLYAGIDPERFPCVRTGSGGFHFYMSKPADLPVLDTLENFPGVEFKSKGRQVVAAGSIHPETGKHYVFVEGHPSLSELPPAPRYLLNMIRRPQRSSGSGTGGTYTQERLARALELVDATAFRDHDKWLRFMMACHYATGGDARDEFIEWSTSDPEYADDAEMIGRRWDSLHKDREDGITTATLNMFLREHGASEAMQPDDAAADFEGVPFEDDGSEEDEAPPRKRKKKKAKKDFDDEDEATLPGGWPEESLSALEKLNEKYCYAVEGGKTRVLFEDYDPVLNRKFWVRMTSADFKELHSTTRIERDTTGLSRSAAPTQELGAAWIQWPKRRTAERVVFSPLEVPNALNLWQGWSYEPSPKGEWTYLRELIHDVLCNGDDRVDEYVMRWLAYMFQYPERRAEVALVFKGGRGVGKGTLGNAIARIIGRHALSIASPELLTGRFNAHLQDVVFLFADEAIRPGDKQAESRLKAFVTEPLIAFEGKGRDVTVAANLLHIMMASNEEWVVPAGSDERRFLVSEVSTSWQGKTEKWEKLHRQLTANNDSGYKRLLLDLLKYDIPHGWHPREFVVTGALLDQKIRSLPPLRQFLFNCCYEAQPPGSPIRGIWSEGAVRIYFEDFRDAFHAWCRTAGINPGSSQRDSVRFLKRELELTIRDARGLLWEKADEAERPDLRIAPSTGRAMAIELPPLESCRESFEELLRGPVEWPEEEGDDDLFGDEDEDDFD